MFPFLFLVQPLDIDASRLVLITLPGCSESAQSDGTSTRSVLATSLRDCSACFAPATCVSAEASRTWIRRYIGTHLPVCRSATMTRHYFTPPPKSSGFLKKFHSTENKGLMSHNYRRFTSTRALSALPQTPEMPSTWQRSLTILTPGRQHLCANARNRSKRTLHTKPSRCTWCEAPVLFVTSPSPLCTSLLQLSPM